ncbi:MAG: hypothetical protein EOP47_19315 [Sphingobacteriaceae bacterium]|nr:MAG: hypothetical protein EOP47_19315 [Sphingobacteriaceae bacterium]
MKKTIILSVIIGMLVTGVYAADKVKKDDDKAGTVSYAVLNQFREDFRDAKNVTWTVSATSQKAEFVENNVKKTAFYSLSGEFLGTTQKVSYDAVPAKAKKEIADTYKDYSVTDVIQLETNEGVQHFVDLKSTSQEVLVRVAPSATVYFFQQVK